MKRKIILILCFLFTLISPCLCSQDFDYPFENNIYYDLGMMIITFKDGIFYYENLYQTYNEFDIEPENFPKTDSGKYTIRQENKYTIVRVNFSSGPRDLIIFYLGEQIGIYDKVYPDFLWGQKQNGDGLGLYYSQKINATSFLTEKIGGKTISYPASNLSNWELTSAWVEGVSGDGIGEEIELLIGSNHLVFANVFFYPQNLSAYNKSNRVRKIRVQGYNDENTLFSKEYELQDTPNLQSIVFPKMVDTVKITILSVYKGTTYTDTAISGIFVDGVLLEKYR